MSEFEARADWATWAAVAIAFVAVIVTLALRSIARRRVGGVLSAESPRDLSRTARWLWILATVVVVGSQWGGEVRHETLLLLGLVVLLAATTPSAHSQQCGDRGVVRGWHARSFGDLEEWRLTGEHLRWKLYGEWQACRVPPRLHADLRERLKRACPERESPFA